MMKNVCGYITGLLFAGLLAFSCTKPTLVGSDLLDDDRDEITFTDTFDLEFSIEPEDSILVFSPSSQITRYLCGRLEDPLMGTSTAETYFEYRLTTNSTDLMASFIDSVVLRLRYDTLGIISNLDEEVTLEVYELTESFNFDQAYYTDQTFPTSMNPIGRKTFIPTPKDSSEVIIAGDTILMPSVLEIRLNEDPTFEPRFSAITDSAVYETLEGFRGEFKGFCIRMTSGSRTMLAFTLSSTYSAIQVYYKDDAEPDTPQEAINFNVDQTLDVKTVHFTHDYTGAPIEAFMQDSSLTDSLIFIQAMGGVNAKLRIPALDTLGNVLINHAELVLSEADLPQDDTLFSGNPIQQLVTRVAGETGKLQNSRDLSFSLSIFGSTDGIGGTYKAGNEGNNIPGSYVINTTAQVQAIANGDAENAIYLASFVKYRNPQRVILYGPGASQHRARLRLTMTKVDL